MTDCIMRYAIGSSCQSIGNSIYIDYSLVTLMSAVAVVH